MSNDLDPNLRHNFIVNVLDGGFFGLGLGFASFVTIIPLFVSQITDSAILIGLIPAIQVVGWQLPQLLTVDLVARLSRYKPMVIWTTLQERIPFFGLAAVAWFLPGIDRPVALILIFLLLIWQGFGGGLTATAWQSMIGKIMPPGRVGTFFGMQSAIANLFGSGGAIVAGLVLERVAAPGNYALCFMLTSIAMTISLGFLGMTREQSAPPKIDAETPRSFWSRMSTILRRDANFRWFLVARMTSQLAIMAFAFYTVYAVHHHGMDVFTAGVMTALLSVAQTAANPVLGWIGDRWSYRAAMQIGVLAATGSALLAWLAPNIVWFYPAFALAGVANVAMWALPMALTLEFSTGSERPAYIGLANTLVAPSTMVAPLIGGWLADAVSYPFMFLVSVIGGLATWLVLFALLRDPRPAQHISQASITSD